MEKSIITPSDRARLLPLVRGEYPTDPAIAVVEQIVREHLGKSQKKDLG